MEIPNLTTEVSLIEDEFIRLFTESILAKVPRYFWTLPASSSGKYHPPIERGPYGLVWHTKGVVKIGKVLLNSRLEVDRSCGISAMILHDVARYGLGEKHSPYSLSNHPDLAADFILASVKDTDITHENFEKIESIAQAVRTHMGRWSKSALPQTDLDWLVHYADTVDANNY